MLWDVWFPTDYDNQEIIWYDEFNHWGTRFNREKIINHFLNVTSDGRVTVECKGGHFQSQAILIILSGNICAEDMVDQLGNSEIAKAVKDRLMGTRNLKRMNFLERSQQRECVQMLVRHISNQFDLVMEPSKAVGEILYGCDYDM